jgi:hypothetical protein
MYDPMYDKQRRSGLRAPFSFSGPMAGAEGRVARKLHSGFGEQGGNMVETVRVQYERRG